MYVIAKTQSVCRKCIQTPKSIVKDNKNIETNGTRREAE